MNVRIATEVKDDRLRYVKVMDNCRDCPNVYKESYFTYACCSLTDAVVGALSDVTFPIPESCPLPGLLEISQEIKITEEQR